MARKKTENPEVNSEFSEDLTDIMEEDESPEEEEAVADSGIFSDDEEIIIEKEEEELEPEPDGEEPESEETDRTGKGVQSYRSRILPESIGGTDRVEQAGKRAKRRLYREETVFTEDGAVKTNRQNSKRHKEYVELAASAKEGTILTGELLSREETENGDIMGIVKYGENFFVKIPAEYMVDMSLQPPRSEMQMNNVYKDLINRRIGAQVSFIVMQVIEKSGIAYGSHIDAMVRKARMNYVRKRNDGFPNYREGMLLEAQVVQVNSIGIWVEAFGAETFISQEELDWVRRGDITELYSVGDKVVIRLLEVHPHVIEVPTYKRSINTVKIKASVKQAKRNPNEEYYDRYAIGTTGKGVVTQVTENGIFIIFADKLSVKCRLFDGIKQPTVGTEVLASITDKRDEGYKFWGRIHHIIKEADM